MNTATRATYHHGHLKQSLIEATLELIDEKGPDKVTVAAAAKKAGVSSGAPFRHFDSKLSLMTAVAEVLQNELLTRLQKAADEAAEDDPWEALRTIGLAYMLWALEQPAHFRTYSNRRNFDFESSTALVEGDAQVTGLVERFFERVLPLGPDRWVRARRLNIHSRALLTGLITLYCNGQFPRFGVEDEPAETTMRKTWELFLETTRLRLTEEPAT